jgi:hypothetical protein
VERQANGRQAGRRQKLKQAFNFEKREAIAIRQKAVPVAAVEEETRAKVSFNSFLSQTVFRIRVTF